MVTKSSMKRPMLPASTMSVLSAVKKVGYSMPPASSAPYGGTTAVTVLYGYGPSVREKYSSESMVACSTGCAFDA